MSDIELVLRTHSNTGRVYVRNGITLAVFLDRPVHETSGQCIGLLDGYLDAVPEGALKWAVASATSEEWREIGKTTIARCRSSLAPEAARKRRLTAFNLNDSAGDAPGYSFYFVGKPTDGVPPSATTLVQMTFPLEAVAAERADKFVATVQRLIEPIEFASGYCAPGFQFSDLHLSEAFNEIRPLALRHPGYDVQYNRNTRLRIDMKSRGARWITLLGRELTEQLGGIAELRKQLSAPVEVRTLKHGVMIIAGRLPEVGDVNRGQSVAALRTVAKVLEPVTLFGESEMRIYLARRDEELLRRWERRFLD
jgi:hypothetical protein